MALKTFVLVSGVNNLSDARYCAGMEVDQLGFNVEPDHPNYTSPEKFKEMSDWVSGVEFVAEVSSAVTSLEAVKNYDVHAVKVESNAMIDAAMATGLSVVFAASTIEAARQAWLTSGQILSYVLYSGPADEAVTLANEMPVVLTEGITADSVNGLIENSGLKGIGLQGGDEIRPGFKDFDELADILEAIEIDDLA